MSTQVLSMHYRHSRHSQRSDGLEILVNIFFTSESVLIERLKTLFV